MLVNEWHLNSSNLESSVQSTCRRLAFIFQYTQQTVIDTHRIVNVELEVQDEVDAACCFDNSFEAEITGCLAVISSSTNSRSELPLYRIIENRNNRVCINWTITGLSPNSSYRISLFEVLGNPPFPVRYPAISESFMLSYTNQVSPSHGNYKHMYTSIQCHMHDLLLIQCCCRINHHKYNSEISGCHYCTKQASCIKHNPP